MFENRPTQIAGLLYLLFFVLFILVIAFHTAYWKELLIILIMTIPYTLISLYDIDCVFNGNCNVWGWFKGIFFILYVILTIIITIFLLADFQNTINTDRETKPILVTTTTTTTNPVVVSKPPVPVTYTNKSRSSDPGGNGTYSVSGNNQNEYIATSNCVYNSSNQSWSGNCVRRN